MYQNLLSHIDLISQFGGVLSAFIYTVLAHMRKYKDVPIIIVERMRLSRSQSMCLDIQ